VPASLRWRERAALQAGGDEEPRSPEERVLQNSSRGHETQDHMEVLLTERKRAAMASAQTSPAHEDIEKLAYHLWEERGAPIGSPEADWERAEQELSAASAPAAAAPKLADPGDRPAESRSSARQRAEHNG
jgi:hypothetical protein